jgi:phosphoserine phosphatase
LANLQAAVEKAMSDLDIQAVFQSDDVFNKKKRVILFQIGSSFIGSDLLEELSEHAGLTLAEVRREYQPQCVTDSLQRAAARLEGLPSEVLQSIATGIQASPGTMELLQTLRVMGYRIALASNAFALFTDTLQTRLGIDYAYGYPLAIDDDSKCVLGEIPAHELAGRDLDQLVAEIAAAEGIQSSDVTVISDEGMTGTPGIRLQLNLGQLLDYVNKNIISREALFGLVGSLGIPRG